MRGIICGEYRAQFLADPVVWNVRGGVVDTADIPGTVYLAVYHFAEDIPGALQNGQGAGGAFAGADVLCRGYYGEFPRRSQYRRDLYYQWLALCAIPWYGALRGNPGFE